MSPTPDQIRAALAAVRDPVSGQDIVAADLVRALTVEGGTVRFVLEVAPEHGAAYEPVRAAAQAAAAAVPGVSEASVLLTAHSAPKPPDLKIGRHPKAQQGPQKVPGVDRILAVGSGKGGVGKSTVAANLAVALARAGRRVGLLDADVYGPSQPRMMGVSKRPASPDGKIIIPLESHGVTVMSLGLMVREDQAIVWRGPMLMGALQQMLGQVQWGDLDVLIIDLPPGTGDVQLTLAQKTAVAGAVIVSTPQDVALLDARKAIDMFNRLNVPIAGIIENMSTHICSNCGHEEHIFGHGGAAAEAASRGVPFLGEIPLHLDIRLAGDGGTPIAAQGGPHAAAFDRIAAALVAAEVA
ncbi:MAG: Mrp/NBP35 family ATP-binding protein [Pseudomonadota bacterium]